MLIAHMERNYVRGDSIHIIAESERLYLRKIDKYDIEFLSRLFGDKDVMRFYPGLRDRRATQDWIENTILNYQKYGHGKWIIVNKENSNPIGHCGLIKMDIGGKVQAELGYFLAKEYWGKGYATEAAKIVIRLGFSKFGYDTIISTTDPENTDSVSVAKRLGMTFKGTESIEANGNFFESDVYSISRPNSTR